jgi:hypothetical protein
VGFGSTGEDEIGERADTNVGFKRMPESLGPNDGVAIAASNLGGNHKPCFGEVADDDLHGTFGDADLGCDVAHPDLRVECQANEDVAMVGQQGPGRRVYTTACGFTGHPSP